MSLNSKIVAVLPVYNEEKTIIETINALKEIELIDYILVVDDGSTDNTVKEVNKLQIDVLKLNKNYGKGYAIKKAVREINYEYLILADGDLGKSAKEIEKLINTVINNECDVSIAKFPRAKKRGGLGLVKSLAKYGVFFYTKKRLDSTISGQRVYKKVVISSMGYIPDRFGIEIAMTIGALRAGYSIKEVEVEMTHRETGRDIRGIIHRGRQFIDILKTLIILSYRR